jgi:hypothetical protein
LKPDDPNYSSEKNVCITEATAELKFCESSDGDPCGKIIDDPATK